MSRTDLEFQATRKWSMNICFERMAHLHPGILCADSEKYNFFGVKHDNEINEVVLFCVYYCNFMNLYMIFSKSISIHNNILFSIWERSMNDIKCNIDYIYKSILVTTPCWDFNDLRTSRFQIGNLNPNITIITTESVWCEPFCNCFSSLTIWSNPSILHSRNISWYW